MRTLFCLAPLFILSLPAAALAQAPAPGGAPPGAPDDTSGASPVPEAPAPERPPEAEEPDEAASPPPKGKGIVHGTITDTHLREPLPEAEVTVLETGSRVVADFDGNYRLELPPGTYTLRVYYELHRSTRLSNVRVIEGEVLRLDAELVPEEDAVDVVEVETTADTSSVTGQILRRQRAASVGDAIGRAEISKNPDRSAAQAAQRVVGATIQDGRFVFVRGLGNRYSNALLNGAPLPSPEPDRAAVPLDLFPSLVLESITITKTFTPDVPGDFAGGSVWIDTRQIPSEFFFNTSLRLGFDTQATFRDRLSHKGSPTDFLGFDGGTRGLPDEIPTSFPARRGAAKPNGERVGIDDPSELERYGEALNAFMSPTEAFTPPDHSLSVVLGDGFDLAGEQRIGYLASINYGRSFYRIPERSVRVFAPDEGAPSGRRAIFDYEFEHGGMNVNWGAFGSLTYELDRNHRFNLIGFHSQLATKETSVWQGFSDNNKAYYAGNHLEFVSRALNFGQLRGEHTFPGLNDAQLSWNGALSHASRDQPDTRDTAYNFNDLNRRWTYVNGSESGRHFFSSQGELSKGGGVDWTQPLTEGVRETKLKLGGLFNLKDRQFSARRFALRPTGGTLRCPEVPDDFDPSCPDEHFTDDNIGTILNLEEQTRDTDAYRADLNVFAAYAMVDAGLSRDLRLILGERVEVTHQSIEPFDPFDEGRDLEGVALDETHLLPAASLVYSATKRTKMRLAASRTLARPQLRELAPFAFADYFGGRIVSGNPELELTRINNLDYRVEFFPSLSEVLAFSLFYKTFEDPIEPIVVPSSTTNTLTFRNTPGARLVGIELEARKDLEFFHPALDPFGVVFNLTLADSRIQVEQTGQDFLTNLSRPLAGQAPYVVNAALDYENETTQTSGRILYNLVGPRLDQVGTEGLDDAYLQPRHVVDASISQRIGEHFVLQAQVQDLLNTEYVVTIGRERESDDANVIERFRNGADYTLSVSYTH